MPKINYSVHKKETIYFTISIIVSILLYYFIVSSIYDLFNSSFHQGKSFIFMLLFYAVTFGIYFFFRFGVLIGHLRGNAIKVNKNQFPDIYSIVYNQAYNLELKSIPDVYILQSGGALNAFAARFMGSNYIVLYSEIVESAYEQDKNILEFIIAHELGHIKRNHMVKRLLLLPSYLIPFLGAAYSRACEYTCDRIGFALAPNGVKAGLLILGSGRSIYKKVNIDEYLYQGKTEDGFWVWFAEKVSSHPKLTKRLAVFEKESIIKQTPSDNVPMNQSTESEHSRYMPN